MKVSDLAKELEVPPSAVLEQCQRFGIDASWAGAELSGADVVVLRAELAVDDVEIDLTPADRDDAPAGASEGADAEAPPLAEEADAPVPAAVGAEDAGSGGGRALPPTAVGSMPDLIDEVTPEPEPETTGGFGFAGGTGGGGGSGPDTSTGPRRIAPRPAPEKRRIDVSVRSAAVAAVLASVAIIGSNMTEAPIVVAVLWLLGAVLLLVCLFHCWRARRHITTHPERLRGLVITSVMAVLAVGALVGLGAAVFTVVSDEPAADAPMGLGDLQAVQSARWGYQRVGRIADNDWKRPAKDAGSCWSEGRTNTPRTEERIETRNESVKCDDVHTQEVFVVYAMDRDADSPYPGAAAILRDAKRRCGAAALDAAGSPRADGIPVRLGVEYPTEQGWDDGDHDIACTLEHPPHEGQLVR